MSIFSVISNLSEVYREFFFTLYLPGIKDSVSGYDIAISTNGSRCPLQNLINGYKYFYTGSSQAISLSKTLASNPSGYMDIPIGVIPSNVILSRQIVGNRFWVDLCYFDNASSLITQTISTGLVGNITQNLTSVKLDLVSYNERLKSRERYTTSVTCMNASIDGIKCSLSNQSKIYPCLGLSNSNILLADITSNILTIDSSKEYEVVIGNHKFIVNKTISGGNQLGIYGYLLAPPQYFEIRLHCNGSYQQCKRYNNLSEFNGMVMLTGEGINISL